MKLTTNYKITYFDMYLSLSEIHLTPPTRYCSLPKKFMNDPKIKYKMGQIYYRIGENILDMCNSLIYFCEKFDLQHTEKKIMSYTTD